MPDFRTIWAKTASFALDGFAIEVLWDELQLKVKRLDKVENEFTVGYRVLEYFDAEGTILWLRRTGEPDTWRFELQSTTDRASQWADFRRSVESAIHRLAEQQSPASSTNDVTRLLCAEVLIDPPFADLVFRALNVRHVRALAPSPGVDLVPLARHAAWSVDKRRHRHLVMTTMTALAIITLPLILVGLGLWLAIAASLVLSSSAWAVADQARVYRMATHIIDEGLVPDLGADLIDEIDEQRLAVVNDANLSIYAPELDDNPFPGAGQRVATHVSPTIDIYEPRDVARPAESFTSSELLEHLALEMPKHMPVGSLVDSCHIGLVLYVRGTSIRQIPELLPTWDGPPVSRAPADLLRLFADEPTSEARTYLRAQIVGYGGQIVTTFHMTAATSPLGLSLDFTLHVLRPIHPIFYEADALPRDTRRLGRQLVMTGGHLRRLISSPRWAWRMSRLLRDAGHDARLSPSQREAVGTQDFYGTFAGLRDVTSLGADLGYDRLSQVERQFNELLAAALREVEAFLEVRNIDTSDFRKQRSNLLTPFVMAYHQTVNTAYNAGVGADGNITVGGNVQANAQNLRNLHDLEPDDERTLS